ncbi:MAG: helix-turn-helix domain-containing protein [Clostridiales bacterium]|nr:helix-turn-helix domain-containing protein [Clostridiales bacterium]
MAKGKYQKWLTEEGLILLEGWARDGLSDEEIAKKMGVSRSTLNEWKNKYSDISDTLKKGKEVADYEIENALFKKAKGYRIREEKLDRFGNVVELEREIPPDVAAIIFWLKNKRPDKWRDRIEKVSVNENDRVIKINISGTGKDDGHKCKDK